MRRCIRIKGMTICSWPVRPLYTKQLINVEGLGVGLEVSVKVGTSDRSRSINSLICSSGPSLSDQVLPISPLPYASSDSTVLCHLRSNTVPKCPSRTTKSGLQLLARERITTPWSVVTFSQSWKAPCLTPYVALFSHRQRSPLPTAPRSEP